MTMNALTVGIAMKGWLGIFIEKKITVDHYQMNPRIHHAQLSLYKGWQHKQMKQWYVSNLIL